MVGGYKVSVRMRLGNQNNPFLERQNKSETKLPKSQFIIFAEGVETEKLYFESLSRSERKRENIIIKYLDRWKENSGRSNQLSVVNDVIEYVDNVRAEKKLDSKKLTNLFNKLVENLKIEELPIITDQLNKLSEDFPSLFNSKESIQSQLYSYLTISEFDSEYDKIFIILDRDCQSFTEEQYREVLQKSEDNQLNLGITNPCFEFFLLLHFENVSDLDLNLLKDNKNDGRKTYAESQLNHYLLQNTGKSFKKNKYDTNYFINNFEIALRQSKSFEIQNERLRDFIGSSVVNIIREMIE